MKPIIFSIFILSSVFLSELNNFLEETAIKNENHYNRKFSKMNIFSVNEKEFTEPKKSFMFFLTSDRNLVYANPINSTDNNFEIKFVDSKTLNPYRSEKIRLQNNAVLAFANSEALYYRHLLNFYRYDFKKREYKRLNKDEATIFDFVVINENMALCIGNIKSQSKSVFGFFTLDLKTGDLNNVTKVLQSSDENLMIENSLKYAGEFVKNGNIISYTFDFYGKVMVFDEKGKLSSHITTIDKIDVPEISHYFDTYTYKRGTTFFTNAGTLIKGNNLFTFSCRPNNSEYLIIDRYELNSGIYKESFKLYYQNKRSSDINYISSNDSGEFVLGFDNFYQGFNANLDSFNE